MHALLMHPTCKHIKEAGAIRHQGCKHGHVQAGGVSTYLELQVWRGFQSKAARQENTGSMSV